MTDLADRTSARANSLTFPLLALAATTFVSSWNGLKIPLFSHLFFLGVGVTIVVSIASRASWRANVLPSWLICIAVLFACLALVDAALPPSPLAGLQARQTLMSSGDLSAPTLFGSNFGNLARLEISLLVFPSLIAIVCVSRRAVYLVAGAWLVGTTVSAAVGVSDAFLGTNIGGTLTGTALSIAATGRQVGLTSQPNHLAVSCALTIPVALVWLASHRRILRWSGAAAVAILLIAIAESGSRGGIVVAPLTALATLYAIPNLRRYFLPLVAVMLVTLAGVLSSSGLHLGGALARVTPNDQSAASSDISRSLLSSLALSQAESRPLTGFGLAQIQAAHIIYVELAASGGVTMLFGFLAMCIGYFRSAADAALHLRDKMAIAALISFGSWLTVGLVENQIVDGYLYVAPGLILALAAIGRSSDIANPPASPRDVDLALAGA